MLVPTRVQFFHFCYVATLAIIHKKNVEEFKNPAIFYHFSHILELGKFQILPNNKGFDGFPFSKREKERKKMSN
jgi:hypothetical protein